MFTQIIQLCINYRYISSITGQRYIVPIFKNGLLDDPSNYRGLTIGGNICKLFTKILNSRLDNLLIKRNIVCLRKLDFVKVNVLATIYLH